MINLAMLKQMICLFSIFFIIMLPYANAYVYELNTKPNNSMISFQASGFHPSSKVTIYWDNILASIVKSDSKGQIQSPPYSINGAPVGIHHFYSFDNYGNVRTNYFVISPK